MGRLDMMPGPGDLRIPDPDCVKAAADDTGEPGGYIDWCDTHDQPWSECGGMEPNYDDEPVAP